MRALIATAIVFATTFASAATLDSQAGEAEGERVALWPEGKVPEAKPEKPKTSRTTKKNAPKGAAPKPIKIQLANGSVIYFDDPDVAAAFTLALGNA